MGRNVVVCCDGTANEFTTDHTNVLKLLSVLHNDPARQIAFYQPGLGTMEAAGALTSFTRKFTKFLGLAVGYGLERDVRDAYVFLMSHFQADDSLFLFGFSRGAYTVRAVAALLHMYGLLPAGNEPLVPYAIRMLTAVGRDKGTQAFGLAAQFKATFRGPVCKPHFVGVWDTVSSIGWIENPLKLPYTANNPDIATGRHAVSIDERRAFFRTNLWRPDPAHPNGGPKDLKQVWFPGVHKDVGGGYAEAESGVSKFAFEWMIREAAKAGLLVDRRRVDEVMGRSGTKYAKADFDAKIHKSLAGWWHLAEFVPKKHWNSPKQREQRWINLYRRRTVPVSSLVHEVAFRRTGYKVPVGAIMEKTDPW